MLFKIFTLLFAIGSVSVFGSDCDVSKCDPIPKHYEELSCKPIKKGGECCSLSFDCQNLQSRDNKKCFYKDKSYSSGDVLDESELVGSCKELCTCKGTKFTCDAINCPENFGPRPEPGCVRQYAIDKCCSIGTVCGEAGEPAKNLSTCDFEGKTYREGDRMQPQDFKCHKCVCTKDFENKPVAENPNCVKTKCLIELFEADELRDGCIPTYHKDSCCPYSWRCPSKNDAIRPGNQDKKPDPDSPKCKFGQLILDIGDSLSPDESGCSSCSCNTPPMADCVFTGC